jgi:hypothetical protein
LRDMQSTKVKIKRNSKSLQILYEHLLKVIGFN